MGESRWRRRFLKSNPVARFSIQASVVLSAIVAFPALFARQWEDEQYVMYLPEHLRGSQPWMLIDQVIDEIPIYLENGVFRPVSHLLLYLEHWFVVRVAALTGVAPNILMSVVKIAMVFVLVTMVMMTIDQYRRAAGGKSTAVHWRRLYGFTAVLIGMSLVLFNPASHPLTLFPGLYLGTAAIALAVPLWFGRSWLRYRSAQPLRRMWIRVGSAVIIGALLASMVEIAYLALPLGFLHLLLLSFAAGDSWGATWKDLFRSEAFLLWALVTTGFLVVFIPARVAIADYCAQLSCYRATELSLGMEAVEVWPYRVGSSFFPVSQWTQIGLVRELRNSPEFIILAVLAAGFAFLVLRRTVFESEEDERGRRPRLPMALIGIYFGAVLIFSSALAAVSGGGQDIGADFAPWRETGFTWIAWGVILAVTLTAFYDWLYDRSALVLSITLVVLVALTAVLNQADMADVNTRTDTRLYNQVGLMLANFDGTPQGNADRCAVLDGLREAAPSDSEARRVNQIATYVDSAAENIYGTEFCTSGSS